MIRNCFGVSSIFTVGGSGDSITAQEESFGNAPVGARRTRKTPSRKAVMRTLAAPAVSSTPSLSFSTRWTLPTCCQPWATTAPPLRAQASRPIPMCRATPVISTLPGMRKKRRTIKRVSYPCSYDAASSGEPLFEKCRCLCAFDAAPDGIQHAASRRFSAAVKTEPIRQIDFAVLTGDVKAGLPKLEKALLKNDAQHFFAQQFDGAIFAERRRQPVAGIGRQELAIVRDSREFEKVERAIYHVKSEQARAGGSAELVANAVKPEWHIGRGDLSQWAATHTPDERRNAGRGEGAHRFLLGDVRFQRSNGRRSHDGFPAARFSGSRSTSRPPWRSAAL